MKDKSFHYPVGPGVQPVRAVHSLILGLFENASPEFSNTLSEQIKYFGANPRITYDIVPDAVEGPFIQGAEGTIYIQETFLSYLWAVTYSHLLLVDEEITRPRIEPDYSRSETQAKLIDDAYNVLIYALGLREVFAPWDTEALPNPEIFAEEEIHYVGKSSAVFVQAIVFILIHEFAHLYLGHLESGVPVDNAESIEDETKADNYAIAVMKEGADFLINKQTVYCGVVVGLIAVLFLNPSLAGDTHPDPHQRLYSALIQMDLEPNNMLWALASTGIALWAHFYRKPRIGGHDLNSLRENFEKMLDELSDPDFFMC
ncbi:phage exclusion protein Lit family protein [Hymenobacter edaphi]|uniref:Uncharacterized protein n=1 Tax=Hymenobacter edaphi TaxID=2211146 RepID=A0A328BA24_9BACT|nr:phage exclusion protein Lit family protein [Hymenobacter edaphi]RAK62564.1 hypothetical protein DLM85_23020 [Hymenobacter edaphi]